MKEGGEGANLLAESQDLLKVTDELHMTWDFMSF